MPEDGGDTKRMPHTPIENSSLSNDKHRQARRFLIPVPSLGVPRSWQVGKVTFHPAEMAVELIPAIPGLDEEVENILTSHPNGSIAEIWSETDIGPTADVVRASLDALRLLLLIKRQATSTHFGLQGEILDSRIEYVAITGGQIHVGGAHTGSFTGFTFDEAAVDFWCESEELQFLNLALSSPASNGHRRAIKGVRLLSRAALENQADLKILGVMSALEAWLGERSGGPQTYNLARRATWLSCRGYEGSLCNRKPPACPYILLSPSCSNSLRRLRWLKDNATDPRYRAWQCTDWHRFSEWYGARSEAAHGGDPAKVDMKTARKAEYWVVKYLTLPILDWLDKHPENPVADLDEKFKGPEPVGWSDMLEAIDREDPTPPSVFLRGDQ